MLLFAVCAWYYNIKMNILTVRTEMVSAILNGWNDYNTFIYTKNNVYYKITVAKRNRISLWVSIRSRTYVFSLRQQWNVSEAIQSVSLSGCQWMSRDPWVIALTIYGLEKSTYGVHSICRAVSWCPNDIEAFRCSHAWRHLFLCLLPCTNHLFDPDTWQLPKCFL